MHTVRLLPTLLLGLLVLAACAGRPAAEMTDAGQAAAVEEQAMDAETMDAETMDAETMDADADEAAHEEDMSSDAMDGEADASADSDMEMAEEQVAESDSAEMMDEPMAEQVERPAWQQIALVDARSGEQFTLADFAGKTVFVEPFATWCGNCRRQLGNVQSAHAALGDDVVFLALSVEPNIGNDALVSYADGAGFSYAFAAMPQEMLQELAAIYGQTVANPPATPHFIIRPDGSTTDLVTGIKSSDVLIQNIQAAAG